MKEGDSASSLLNEELAEFLGAFVGDGCLSKYKRSDRKKRYIEGISFTGSWKNDSQYYKEIIKPLLNKNFGITPNIKHRLDDDSARARTSNKRLSAFLIEKGFNFGSKSKTVDIPREIRGNKKFHKAFLRGLFNTAGSVCEAPQSKLWGI